MNLKQTLTRNIDKTVFQPDETGLMLADLQQEDIPYLALNVAYISNANFKKANFDTSGQKTIIMTPIRKSSKA
jgi:hypothetical protein